MTGRCQNCKYFFKTTANQECRRYPPQVFGGNDIRDAEYIFPRAVDYFWCGEFVAKPVKCKKTLCDEAAHMGDYCVAHTVIGDVVLREDDD